MNVKYSHKLSVISKLLLSTLSFAFSITYDAFAVALVTMLLYGSFIGVIIPY